MFYATNMKVDWMKESGFGSRDVMFSNFTRLGTAYKQHKHQLFDVPAVCPPWRVEKISSLPDYLN